MRMIEPKLSFVCVQPELTWKRAVDPSSLDKYKYKNEDEDDNEEEGDEDDDDMDDDYGDTAAEDDDY